MSFDICQIVSIYGTLIQPGPISRYPIRCIFHWDSIPICTAWGANFEDCHFRQKRSSIRNFVFPDDTHIINNHLMAEVWAEVSRFSSVFHPRTVSGLNQNLIICQRAQAPKPCLVHLYPPWCHRSRSGIHDCCCVHVLALECVLSSGHSDGLWRDSGRRIEPKSLVRRAESIGPFSGSFSQPTTGVLRASIPS